MTEIAATDPSLEKDFSAPSARSLRRAFELLGWLAERHCRQRPSR